MFKKLTEDALLPERATKNSAGFDVFANENVVIGAGETKLIGLGVSLCDDEIDKAIFQNNQFLSGDPCKIEILNGITTNFKSMHYFALHIRSSLRAKGLTSLGTGIIDMDYRDEIKMVIHNPIAKLVTFQDGYVETLGLSDVLAQSSIGYEIKKGDKIGQLILCRHEGWLLPSEYTKDEERNGGFGSTGK